MTKLQNLNAQDRIVNEQGQPTMLLMRMLQDRGIIVGDTQAQVEVNTTAIDVNTTNITTNTAAISDIEAIDITSVDGTVTVTNGSLGNGGLDIDLEVEEQAVLDKISTTQGTILYRGASDWAALAPGTALQVLTTNGAGADPTWEDAAAGGGGGSAPFRGALAYHAGTTGVNISGGLTVVDFTNEAYDTDAFHDTSTNPSRMTIPAGVTKVRLSASIYITSATADRESAVTIYKNGAIVAGYPYHRQENGSTAWGINLQTAVLDVVAGDYFQVQAYNEGDTSVNFVSEGSWFAIEVIEDDNSGDGRVAFSKLTATGTTSLPNNTVTAIAFATEDTAGAFRASSPPANGFKIPAGVTHVRFSWMATVTAQSGGVVGFRVLDGSSALVALSQIAGTSSGSNYSCVTTGPIAVSEGDTFTLSGFQNGGATEDANGGFGSGASDYAKCFFAIEDVTP